MGERFRVKGALAGQHHIQSSSSKSFLPCGGLGPPAGLAMMIWKVKKKRVNWSFSKWKTKRLRSMQQQAVGSERRRFSALPKRFSKTHTCSESLCNHFPNCVPPKPESRNSLYQHVKEDTYFICRHGKKTLDINVSGMSLTLKRESKKYRYENPASVTYLCHKWQITTYQESLQTIVCISANISILQFLYFIKPVTEYPTSVGLKFLSF